MIAGGSKVLLFFIRKILSSLDKSDPELRAVCFVSTAEYAVDIFGPYSLKNGRKVHKRYAVLFTCMSCRAVHIEVAFSLTTDSFINAYRSLVPIRGKVNVLRSDCGTNFNGAEREIRHELDGIDNNRELT